MHSAVSCFSRLPLGFLPRRFERRTSPKHRNFPVHNQPGGSAMSQTKGDDRFEGLLCVKCGAQMRFSCTELEPGKPGFVHRVYECTECRSTQSFERNSPSAGCTLGPSHFWMP